MKTGDQTQLPPFPARLLTGALAISVLLMVGLVWSAYQSYRTVDTVQRQSLSITELQRIIVHLDEALSMSARMAAVTGDLAWERRYRQLEPQLKPSVKKALVLASEMGDVSNAAQMKAAILKLTEMENRSFVLVHEGRADAARALLFSPEYETQDRISAEGTIKLDRLLGQHLKYREKEQHRAVVFSILVSAVVVGLLLFTWLTVLSRLRLWRTVQLRSFDQLAHADEELRNAHSLLEKRVKERTNELEKASLEVQASAARMRAITNSAQDAILMMDPEGRVSFWNPAAEHILGYTNAEAIGQDLHKLIAPARYHKAHYAAFPAFLRTGQGAAVGKTLDLETRRKDGQEISVQLSLSAVQINGGWHAVGLIRDTTERKRAEERLRESEGKLRSILEAVQAGIVLIDSDTHTIVEVNPAAAALIGETKERIVGSVCHRHICPAEEGRCPITDLKQTVDNAERVLLKNNGTRIPIIKTVVPIVMGGRQYLLESFVDITARKQAEAQLLETNRQLAATTARANELAVRADLASRAKGEFLASMSHEIRTPMNGVMGMLGLLHDSELSDHQREFVQIARSSADALLNIINDILDFSKIEAGKLTLEPIPFDLRTAVEEVGEILASKVAEKGLDLIVRFAPGTPRNVIGDPGRVRQVLTNLVGNAVKFTTAGHVLISVQCERQTEPQAQLRFSVEDTGIGIAADHLDHIFEKFTQADASTTRRFGGTGLGLAISKQLTELMGGSISVTSQPGKGSTFSFTLPFNLPGGPLPTAPPRTFLEGVRVLIVDDNEVNRRVLHEQVSSWRMRDDGSASGEEALTKLREAQAAGDPYSIAILDYQMPGMDGEMLARAITADPELRAPLLVMLTSLGHPTNANCLKEAGIFACLLKPVRQSKLWDALAEAWGAHTRQSPIQLPTRPTPAEPRPAGKTARKVHARVLVVDDNTTNQKVARLMLESLGCRVDLSANGREALEMLELLPYDAVFMDCEMPEMDGYEATAEIRRRRSHDRHIPVIAMTAKAIQGDRERCLKAGMDDYISKPVRMEDLEAALARWIPHNGNIVPAAPKDLPPAVPAEAVVSAIDPSVTARLRDLAAATDPSVLGEIYEAFLSSGVDYLAAIRQGAAANDAEGLRKTAHAFKGASANIGAQHLAELCRQLEALGEAERVDGAVKHEEQLEQEFARVKVEIENQTGKKGAV